MTRIILVRHGESEANLNRILAGQLDFPLTELGVYQAELAAKYILKHEKIDAVYSSDLRRAVNTAKPLADALGLPINTDKRLREFNSGVFQGLTVEERKKCFPGEVEQLMTDMGHMQYPGGEYVPDIYDRVVGCICEISRANPEKTVLIVSHNGAMLTFDAFAHGYSREEVGKTSGFLNASINIYECDGEGARVIAKNITEHLSDTDNDTPDTDKQ